MTARSPVSVRLRRLAEQARERSEAELERCELCSEPIPPEHRHVLDLRDGDLKCACRACALLFDRDGAGAGNYRSVGDRRLALEGVPLDDMRWLALGIPVDMAFFVRRSGDGRVHALYPSPVGVTEAQIDADAWWRELEADSPVLRLMTDDVEALLVNRARGARQLWIVPLDDAYRLVALFRTHWRGLTGGTVVWEELRGFFEELGRRAKTAPSQSDAPRSGGGEARWPG